MTTFNKTASVQEKGHIVVPEKAQWRGAKPIPFLITALVGAGIWAIPVPAGLTPQAWHLFAIFLFIITGLVTRPLPVAPMVLMGSLIAITTHTLTFKEISIGLSSPSIWLIFVSFFLAQGLIKTGLAMRASYIFVRSFGHRIIGLVYGIILSELILAPFIPSLVARAGGIIFPIVLALAKTYDEQDKTLSTGRFLIIATFQGSVIVSAMFLTSMAANPIAAEIASEFGITLTWGKWFLASSVPGIASILIIPMLLKKIIPPKLSHSPEAPVMASDKLKEMGKMTLDEKLMLGIFFVVLNLWLFGAYLKISNTTAALLGVMFLLFCGVINWKDCLKEHTAWDTLFWLGTLVAIGTALKNLGFFTWFSMNIVSFISSMTWHWAFLIMIVLYFYSHYFFASNTAHLTAMYSAFLAAAIQIGAPPLLTVLILAFFSSLFGGLTHYSCGPAPIFFSSGYVSLKKWWQIGLIMSICNILVWLVVGGLWWKILKFW
ncbi:MAG: putative malate transporter YflS [Chlamydiae bacterium]|nr:putative malate transporter YflS [Chlamydiota bacterium]